MERLYNAVKSLLEIGKKDLSNPKYEGYWEELKQALSGASLTNQSGMKDELGELPPQFVEYLKDFLKYNNFRGDAELKKYGGCWLIKYANGETAKLSIGMWQPDKIITDESPSPSENDLRKALEELLTVGTNCRDQLIDAAKGQVSLNPEKYHKAIQEFDPVYYKAKQLLKED